MQEPEVPTLAQRRKGGAPIVGNHPSRLRSSGIPPLRKKRARLEHPLFLVPFSLLLRCARTQNKSGADQQSCRGGHLEGGGGGMAEVVSAGDKKDVVGFELDVVSSGFHQVF